MKHMRKRKTSLTIRAITYNPPLPGNVWIIHSFIGSLFQFNVVSFIFNLRYSCWYFRVRLLTLLSNGGISLQLYLDWQCIRGQVEMVLTAQLWLLYHFNVPPSNNGGIYNQTWHIPIFVYPRTLFATVVLHELSSHYPLLRILFVLMRVFVDLNFLCPKNNGHFQCCCVLWKHDRDPCCRFRIASLLVSW